MSSRHKLKPCKDCMVNTTTKTWCKPCGYKNRRKNTWDIGKPKSEAVKQKISDTKKGVKNPRHSEWLKNNPNLYWLGKKRPELSGDKNPNWKGGYQHKLFLNRQRRIMKLGNGGSHTLIEWEQLKRQYNFMCPACNLYEPEITLTVDHIVPVSKKGTDDIDNIQPLCKGCNTRKKDKVMRYAI